MFGFLKKKLKDAKDKIVSLTQDVSIEKIEESVKEEIEKKEEIDKEEIEKTEKRKIKKKEAEKTMEVKKESKPEKPKIEHDELSKKPEKKEAESKESKGNKGLFDRIKKKIMEKTLTENDLKDILWDLQVSLIESDVALEVAEKICADLKENLVGKSVGRKNIESIVKDSLSKSITEIIDIEKQDIENLKKPALLLLIGFNGSGKTTTAAKLAAKLKENYSVVLAAGDTFRAAAIHQLEEHGNRLGVKVIKQDYGSDSAAVIFDAMRYAEAKNIDFVIADTAGRAHSNVNLMDELKKICRVNKPSLKILVVDSLTGNDVVEQAEYFNNAVEVDGIIMTKADVYDKGGAVLSVVHSIKKPILYFGIGQEYADLEKFDVEKTVEKMLE